MPSPRILFLAPSAHDYLTDGMFHGLTQLLGHDHVIDCPRQDRYHERSDAAAKLSKYPMLHFIDNSDRTEPHDLERLDLRSFDMVIIGRLDAALLPALRVVLSKVEPERLVYLDGMDDPYLRGWLWRKVGLYFKRELLVPTLAAAWYNATQFGYSMRQNVRWIRDWFDSPARYRGMRHAICAPLPLKRRILPMPFGVIDVGYSAPPAEKEHDIAFIGTLSSPRRREVLATLEEWNKKRNLRLLVKITRRISWHEYLDTLSRTRVCLNVRGAGIDTYRYWEIPYTGSLLLSEQPLIEIPNNFEDGKHAAFFHLPQLKTTLDRLFDQPNEIPRMAAAGTEHLLRHHTTVSRARNLLEKWHENRPEQRNSG